MNVFENNKNGKQRNGKNNRTEETEYRENDFVAGSWYLDTILISWLVVENFNFAVTIGGVELFTKMTLYFFIRASLEPLQLRAGERDAD